jgi:hypothetical protein
MEKSTKIILGIAGGLALIGWIAFARRHNGKPAYVPPNPDDLPPLEPGQPLEKKNES